MKSFLAILAMLLVLSSCQNKTLQLLNKKWDCVKIDNLDLIDKKAITSAADSIAANKIATALAGLNWTFNKDHSYYCGVSDKITSRGNYEVNEDEKTLVCTTQSQNTVNRYTITTLTDDDLVLTSLGSNVNLVLHFKPN